MSLLWKKPRFMSEFQHSPKRGVIMVVETGFPTSLIDLFFKSRDRLKKSSSKTKRIQRLIQTAPDASLPISPDVSLEKPVARKTVRSKIEKVSFVSCGVTAENKHTRDKNGCVCVCSGGSSALFFMAFKIFIVAVLALSTTKNLTMGITLSAFALLLAENSATRFLTRFKLCNTDTKRQKPLSSIHDEKLISCGKIETFDAKPCTKAIACLEETETIAVTENSSLKDVKIRDLLSKDEKSKSKSSRLQSKILKKLRSYSKKKNKKIMIKEETSIDVSSLVPEDKSEVIEAESDEEKSNPPLIESKGDKMNGTVVIVIVLTGLLSGKIVAIGLTLSCLYLRYGAAKKSALCI